MDREACTWLTGTYDAELDTIYWPTGNPTPDLYGDDRKGDNLYSDSIIALDAKTGKPYWTHDMLAAVWASPIVVDDKVYLGDEDGDVVVLQHGKEKKLVGEFNMGSSVYCSVVPANGNLIVANRNHLFSIGSGGAAPGAAPSKPAPAPAPAKSE